MRNDAARHIKFSSKISVPRRGRRASPVPGDQHSPIESIIANIRVKRNSDDEKILLAPTYKKLIAPTYIARSASAKPTPTKLRSSKRSEIVRPPPRNVAGPNAEARRIVTITKYLF